jgi:hypothetical protein
MGRFARVVEKQKVRDIRAEKKEARRDAMLKCPHCGYEKEYNHTSMGNVDWNSGMLCECYGLGWDNKGILRDVVMRGKGGRRKRGWSTIPEGCMAVIGEKKLKR